MDTLSPKPTDLLDENVWTEVERDLTDGVFDAVFVATPCGTFSPLREKPPGPRPLRTVEKIAGLPKSQLSMAEQAQLKEANILVSRTATAIIIARERKKPWGLENPDHPPGKPSLWLMHSIQSILKKEGVQLCKFDQCRTGLETTKPTAIAHEGLDLSELHQLRCNHPKVQQETASGEKYMAAHPSPAQRWRKRDDGKMERASRALGEYTAQLSSILAQAFHRTQRGAAWLSAELSSDTLP